MLQTLKLWRFPGTLEFGGPNPQTLQFPISPSPPLSAAPVPAKAAEGAGKAARRQGVGVGGLGVEMPRSSGELRLGVSVGGPGGVGGGVWVPC